MIDFTSSLYLNMKHSSRELPEWQQLTTGVPAALHESFLSKQVSNYIASMQGLEAGIASPSTMHLYWDLFGLLSKQQNVFFIDEKVYPVSNYGIERLTAANAKAYKFRHLNAEHLEALIKSKLKTNTTPVIITDGWCPPCSKHAPLQDYVDIVKPFNGTIIIDDTQAFGVLGEKQTKTYPYGKCGNGILKWLNVKYANIITITSLAKAFGAPMAVMSTNKMFADLYEENSETRVNSSPVSIAHLSAALNALQVNHTSGDERRRKLWNNVSYFKKQFEASGIQTSGGIFPIQNISYSSPEKTIDVFKRLKRNKIKTVLTAPHKQHKPSVSFVLRCDHLHAEIDNIINCMQERSRPVERAFYY